MKVWCAVRAQRGYGLIELLVSVATGLLLMTGLTVLLVSFDELADLVRQRADLQERVRLIEQMWRLALEGAGHMGCLAESAAVESLLNASWAELGLLRPWPAAEIVQDPASSPFFSASIIWHPSLMVCWFGVLPNRWVNWLNQRWMGEGRPSFWGRRPA